jgi:DNA-directed RNA polymerase specialized sigma24 family protein
MGPPSAALRELARRTGAGDRRAFRKLYEMLAPDVFAAASAELADSDQALQIMRATFCEVWWLSACFNDNPRDRHITSWACGIARARAIERQTALSLIALDPEPDRNFWADLLASQDTSVRAVFRKVLTPIDQPVPVPAFRRLLAKRLP